MLGTLLGNYRVVAPLGEGGMGVVYVGRHETLGHRVVVKVLLPELSSHADMVQRFFNEAQAATAIRNPGIVQVFDFGSTPDGRAYFVMELLEGETLSDRLRRRRYDHAESCRLGRQIANVLQAAHSAGITHRDLKPDNLFLVPDTEVIGGERVKVLDFGIAKLAGVARAPGVQTRTDLVMGTPNYMAPEQCRGASNADARSDIYALGCILFELVCGRPPFAAGGLGDVVAAHLHDPPPHPQHLVPDIPSGLATLLMAMLAKQPDARPQTMSAVSHSLDEILHTLGASSASPSSPLPLPASVVSLPYAQASPASTTLRGAVGMSSQSSAVARRLPFILGAAIIACAVAAIALVLANDRAESAGSLVSYNDIVATPKTAGSAADSIAAAQPVTPPPASAPPPAAVTPPVTPSTPPASATPLTTSAPSAPAVQQNRPAIAQADLEAACRGYQVDRKWSELDQCADRLKHFNATHATELKTRATEETRSAPHIASAQTALRNKDLKRARAELDQVWTDSVDYAPLKHSYDSAEAREIDVLATQLDSIKDASCEAYNQLLARQRSTNPSRVIAEATRRVRCTPPPKCDASTLAQQAMDQYRASQFAAAIASYNAAYACTPIPAFLQKALMAACNLRDTARAKAYWKRLSPELRMQTLSVCVRNEITERLLNAP